MDIFYSSLSAPPRKEISESQLELSHTEISREMMNECREGSMYNPFNLIKMPQCLRGRGAVSCKPLSGVTISLRERESIFPNQDPRDTLNILGES